MSKILDPDYPVFLSSDVDTYELINEDRDQTDRDGREYEGVGQFLENDDFYQGLCMITVIRRKSDGELFGFSWWNDISKHGESYIEPNGDDFGLECDTDVPGFDRDTDYVSYYVFEPVVESAIVSYEKS